MFNVQFFYLFIICWIIFYKNLSHICLGCSSCIYIRCELCLFIQSSWYNEVCCILVDFMTFFSFYLNLLPLNKYAFFFPPGQNHWHGSETYWVEQTFHLNGFKMAVLVHQEFYLSSNPVTCFLTMRIVLILMEPCDIGIK